MNFKCTKCGNEQFEIWFSTQTTMESSNPQDMNVHDHTIIPRSLFCVNCRRLVGYGEPDGAWYYIRDPYEKPVEKPSLSKLIKQLSQTDLEELIKLYHEKVHDETP